MLIEEEARVSQLVRDRHFYRIEAAGALLGLSRSEAYRQAVQGRIPTKTVGRWRLVPRREWDEQVRRLLRGA